MHTSIAGALGHNIKQLSVRLGVQFIENNTVGIETVLVANISGKHLVDTARRLIDEPFLGVQDFDTLGECRTHTHHIGGNIENNGCLLSVSSTAIYLGAFLTITAGQQKCNGGSQFGFALFLGNLNICGIELTVAVGLQRSEDVPNNLLLPVNQFKRLARPCSFRMTCL